MTLPGHLRRHYVTPQPSRKGPRLKLPPTRRHLAMSTLQPMALLCGLLLMGCCSSRARDISCHHLSLSPTWACTLPACLPADTFTFADGSSAKARYTYTYRKVREADASCLIPVLLHLVVQSSWHAPKGRLSRQCCCCCCCCQSCTVQRHTVDGSCSLCKQPPIAQCWPFACLSLHRLPLMTPIPARSMHAPSCFPFLPPRSMPPPGLQVNGKWMIALHHSSVLPETFDEEIIGAFNKWADTVKDGEGLRGNVLPAWLQRHFRKPPRPCGIACSVQLSDQLAVVSLFQAQTVFGVLMLWVVLPRCLLGRHTAAWLPRVKQALMPCGASPRPVCRHPRRGGCAVHH